MTPCEAFFQLFLFMAGRASRIVDYWMAEDEYRLEMDDGQIIRLSAASVTQD